MKIRYYVCGFGYDENYSLTGEEIEFGDFDTYEEAFALFTALQYQDEKAFFNTRPEVSHILINVEECVEDDKMVSCIDVKNEWLINNPKLT